MLTGASGKKDARLELDVQEMCQRQCPRRKKKKIKRRRREEKPSDHNAGLTSVKEAGKEGGLD